MQDGTLALTSSTRESISLWKLFVLYLQIGLTGFGPAVAAETKKRLVKGLNWISEDEFAHGLALAQMLPGTVFVSLTVYIGYKIRGIAGALTSFVAFLLPPFSLMLLLSYMYFTYGSLPQVNLLFQGISIAVVGLVAYAVVDIGKSLISDIKGIMIAVMSAVIMLSYPNIFLVLSLAALAGVLLFYKQLAQQAKPTNIGTIPLHAAWALFLKRFSCIAVVSAGLVYVASLQPVLLKLGGVFFRMALLMFGGGFSMIPFFQQEVVAHYKWLTLNEFAVGIALGQVTPGPILITSTFVGYKVAALTGACAATLGVFLPSLIFVILTAEIYQVVVNAVWVKAAIKGIAVAFPGMILVVAVGLVQHSVVDIFSAVFAVATFIILLYGKFDTIYVIIGGTIGYWLISIVR